MRVAQGTTVVGLQATASIPVVELISEYQIGKQIDKSLTKYSTAVSHIVRGNIWDALGYQAPVQR